MKNLIAILFVILFAGCAELTPHNLGSVGCEKKHTELLDQQCANVCSGERYTTSFDFNKKECFCYCRGRLQEDRPSRW
jgi:hypothetical protein